MVVKNKPVVEVGAVSVAVVGNLVEVVAVSVGVVGNLVVAVVGAAHMEVMEMVVGEKAVEVNSLVGVEAVEVVVNLLVGEGEGAGTEKVEGAESTLVEGAELEERVEVTVE